MSIEDILHKHIHQEQAGRALTEKDALLQHSNDHVVAIESTLHVIEQVQSYNTSISHEPHVYMHSIYVHIYGTSVLQSTCTTLSLSHTLTDLSYSEHMYTDNNVKLIYLIHHISRHMYNIDAKDERTTHQTSRGSCAEARQPPLLCPPPCPLCARSSFWHFVKVFERRG